MAAVESHTHDRVYRAIRNDLLTGRIDPAAKITAAAMARQYEASLTPVREALYRLVGEDMVAISARGGFQARRTLEETLIDLLEMSELMLLDGVRRIAGPVTVSELPALAQGALACDLAVRTTERIFEAILHDTGNDEMLRLMHMINDRLRSLRVLECKAHARARDECTHMQAAARAPDKRRLRRQIIRHHFRHIQALKQQIARRDALRRSLRSQDA